MLCYTNNRIEYFWRDLCFIQFILVVFIQSCYITRNILVSFTVFLSLIRSCARIINVHDWLNQVMCNLISALIYCCIAPTVITVLTALLKRYVKRFLMAMFASGLVLHCYSALRCESDPKRNALQTMLIIMLGVYIYVDFLDI